LQIDSHFGKNTRSHVQLALANSIALSRFPARWGRPICSDKPK